MPNDSLKKLYVDELKDLYSREPIGESASEDGEGCLVG
jgi:hypothetical protein